MSKRASLSLVMPNTRSTISSAVMSPTDHRSRSTSPGSRRGDLSRFTKIAARTDESANGGATRPSQGTAPQSPTDLPTSPTLTSLPSFPSSPKNAPRHARDQSRSFFGNLKASKSSNKVHHVESTIRQVSEDNSIGKSDTKENMVYPTRQSSGSTPDLSKSSFGTSSVDISDKANSQGHQISRQPVGSSAGSDNAVITNSSDSSGKRNKPRFAHLLNRTRSMRMDEEGGRRLKPAAPIRITVPENQGPFDGSSNSGGLRTAPVERDQSFPSLRDSGKRNRSADRHVSPNREEAVSQGTFASDRPRGVTLPTSGSSTGIHLFSNLGNTSSKAARGLGKASNRIINKMVRSSSSTGKEEPEPFITLIISLPLVEQTRHTRIAKRLEDSKDKTEFWMCALPWRCIDYLNSKGCDQEGLYRIPGGTNQIAEYWQRFDREGDIDLFNEPKLFDINIIGSVFKKWLRELPSEVLPKDVQARVEASCPDAKEATQEFRDELSKLPPWNYYLLFAVTCHLSLLRAYGDVNKMNYINIKICFQPCIGIDDHCFKMLVCDWRHCWQGCWNEKEYLEEEYRALEGLPTSSDGSSATSTAVVDERSLASSHGSNVPTAQSSRTLQDRFRPPPLSLTQPSEEQLSTPTRHDESTPRNATHLPELAPVVPMSPLGL